MVIVFNQIIYIHGTLIVQIRTLCIFLRYHATYKMQKVPTMSGVMHIQGTRICIIRHEECVVNVYIKSYLSE